jgi:hypothetical protein
MGVATIIRDLSSCKSPPFDNMFGDAPPFTLKNTWNDRKNFGHPGIFRPSGVKAINQMLCPFWHREPESGMAPNILEVLVIPTIHEGDVGMLAEPVSSLERPLRLNCGGGGDWNPLKDIAYFILVRAFEPSTGNVETPTEPVNALIDHVSAWNVDNV